jgi:signal peptidase II
MNFKNRFFWIAAFVGLMLDQVTKYWVVQSMTLTQTIPIWEGVFHLTYVTNKGAAFSLFPGGVWWLRWLSLFVSLGLIAVGLFGSELNRWEQFGWGFVLAGALGNGIDRFAAGEVVDFLDFRLIQFPVFNFADVFINIGIICLLWAAFRKPPQGDDPDRFSKNGSKLRR